MQNGKSLRLALSGLAVGFVNGLLGAGGGMLAVPVLKKLGLSQKEAHSNAVAVILPITALSALLYIWCGYAKLGATLPFIPSGLVGALIGTYLLKKISPKLLKKGFGGFMLYAGLRLLLK